MPAAVTGAGRVAVCVCTYRRPAQLAGLLRALDRQRLGSIPDASVELVVVDNCAARSGAPAVAAYRSAPSRFPVTYVAEAARGLSRARNAALDAGRGADLLALIDDDEVPEPDWLARLVARIRETGAGAAIGPVLPVFEQPPPGWALKGGFFATRLKARSGWVGDGYAGNAIIRRSALDASGVRFDPAFDQTGGEDTFFFKGLLDAGHRIAWAGDAVAHESIPPGRARLGWLLRRWYRTGNIEARLRAGGRLGRAGIAGQGLLRLGAGGLLALGAAVAGGWRDPARVIARLYTVCRGAGMIAAVAGRDYREYAGPSWR